MLAPMRREDGPVKNSNPFPLPTPSPEVSGSKCTYLGKLGAYYHKLFPDTEKDTAPKGNLLRMLCGIL